MSQLFQDLTAAMHALREVANSRCIKCGADLGRKCDPNSEADIPICSPCFLAVPAVKEALEA